MAYTNGMNGVSEYAQFYNSDNHDRVYDADSMAEWLTPFFVDGIFNGQMQVTANGDMTVSVAPGFGYIDGKVKHFPTSTKLTIDIAHAQYPRIDAVVLRRDDTERDFFLDIVKGTPSQNPVAPTLTRNNTIWELQLAKVAVGVGVTSITQSSIEDTRMDSSVCGWVVATVEEIPFDQIKAQFDAWYDEFTSNIESESEAWKAAFEERSENWYAEQTRGFADWFQYIRDQLSEDAAGHLQNQIDDLKQKLLSTIGKINDELIERIEAIEYKMTHSTINVKTTDKFFLDAKVTATSGDTTVTGFLVNGEHDLPITVLGNYTVKVESVVVSGAEDTRSVDVTDYDKTYYVSGFSFEDKISWSSAPDKNITAAVNAHRQGIIDLNDYWAIGDTRSVLVSTFTYDKINLLTDEKATTEIAGHHVPLTIAHKGDVDLENGQKSDFVVILPVFDGSNYYQEFSVWNEKTANTANWSSCYMNQTLINGVFLNALPQYVRDIMVKHKTKTREVSSNQASSSTLVTSIDDLSPLSEMEVFGTHNISGEGEGFQFDYLKSGRVIEWKQAYTLRSLRYDGERIYTSHLCFRNDADRTINNNLVPVAHSVFDIIYNQQSSKSYIGKDAFKYPYIKGEMFAPLLYFTI